MHTLSQCILNNRLTRAITDEKLYLGRIVMMKKSMFVLLLVCGLLLSVPARGEVTVTPTNVQLPTATGEDLSFDFVITDPFGTSAISVQTTISVSGPGSLTFDSTSSEAVNSNPAYWIFGNSGGTAASDLGSDLYEFADGANNPVFEDLLTGDIIARYVFEWDGTVGDYIFSLDLTNTTVNNVFNSDTLNLDPLAFDPGAYTGGSDWFSVTLIPEPATLMLLGLGGLLLRKRRA